MKVGIVILFVKDVARSKKFYTEVVGLSVDEQQSNADFVTLNAGGTSIALENAARLSAAQPGQTPGSVEVGFNVDGVDAVYKRWKEAGAEIILEPEDRPFGRYFVVRDPDGHYLDVFGKQ